MHMGPREWATIQAAGARASWWLPVILGAVVVAVAVLAGACAVGVWAVCR